MRLRIAPIMVGYSSGKAREAERRVCEGFTIYEGHRTLCVVADGMPGAQDHMREVADRIVAALEAAQPTRGGSL